VRPVVVPAGIRSREVDPADGDRVFNAKVWVFFICLQAVITRGLIHR